MGGLHQDQQRPVRPGCLLLLPDGVPPVLSVLVHQRLRQLLEPFPDPRRLRPHLLPAVLLPPPERCPHQVRQTAVHVLGHPPHSPDRRHPPLHAPLPLAPAGMDRGSLCHHQQHRHGQQRCARRRRKTEYRVTAIHSFMMFVPFCVVKPGFLAPGFFLWLTGPYMAAWITPNLMEQASIWCFSSISQIGLMLFAVSS